MTETAVTAIQRFTAVNPCPICGGHPSLPRGRGVRCTGFRTHDGYLHCTREEHAGVLKASSATVPTFAHVDREDCRCGQAHARSGVRWIRSHGSGRHRDASNPPTMLAAYDYVDGAGTLLYQTVRYEPKDFRQRRPDGHGGWVSNLDGVQRVPYRLPELLAADRARTVFVPEGEKDADRLVSLGLIATTNAGGAGKWTDVLSEYLRGRERAVVLSDVDDRGRLHAQATARSLRRVVDDVRVVNLIGLPEHGDISDWLDAGHTIEDLRWVVKIAPPVVGETSQEASADRSAAFTIETAPFRGGHALHSSENDVVAAKLAEIGRLAYARNRLDQAALSALSTLAGASGSSRAAVRQALAEVIAGDAG